MDNQCTLFNKAVWNLFIYPGEVVEVRILKVYGKSIAWGNDFAKGTVSGYFDDHESFCKAVQEADKTEHGGIYFTLQVIDPRLIGRAFNRLKPATLTTSDSNILKYRWIPIDIDPVRPGGISSSDRELQLAMTIREKVAQYCIDDLRLPDPVKGMSGNGGHLLSMLPDIKSNDQSRGFIECFLQHLADKFNTDEVCIDTSVFNPARIWKLYGTTARKGDPVPAGPHREARPYRMAYIDSIENIRPIDRATLGKLFKKLKPEETSTKKTTGSNGASNGKLNMPKYLDHYGVSYKQRFVNGSWFYCLDHCVFDESHTKNDSAIIQTSDGKLLYQCFHNSCKGRKWADARQIISGGDNLFTFMEGLSFQNGVHNNEATERSN